MNFAFRTRVARDIRDAARQLRGDKAYSTVLIVTMTLGIAAASGIFSVVRGVILRPLPYRQPHALASIQEYQPAMRRDQASMSIGAFTDFRAASTSFEALSAFSNSEFVLSDGSEAERVIGATVDAELFPLLGTPPLLGRVFENAEIGESPTRVAIMSFPLWQRRYGGDRGIVGKSIVVDGNPFTVVGVMPERFEFPRNAAMDRDIELWTPRRVIPAMMMRRNMRSMTVVGRMRSGVSEAVMRSEADAIATQFARANPGANSGWSIRVVPLRELMVGSVRRPLLMLFAGVIALLLIVCLNVSAAALARVASRRHSLGVRVALGASQPVLGELLFSESTFLALIAGALAIPLSSAVRAILVYVAPVAIPRQAGIAIDLTTVMFTLAVAVVVGGVTALAPIVWLRGLDVRTVLADSDRGSSSSRFIRKVLTAFVVVQLAMGTILLGATSELYSTYSRLSRIDPGFRPEGVTTASIALRGARYQDARARGLLTEQLLERVRTMPGVEHAAVTSLGPLSGGMMTAPYRVSGLDSDSGATAAVRAVSADFFPTAGILLKQGRTIAKTDDDASPLVAVVNEAFTRQSLNGRGAIGATIATSAPGREGVEQFLIVGVVGDAKEKDLTSPPSPIIYFSSRQASFPHTVLMMRTQREPPIRAVRAALRDLDPALALDDVGGLDTKVRATYALETFLLIVVAAFAASGATLVAVGVYGSSAFAVAADMRSIGVRIALGASPSVMVRAIVGRTLRHAAVGCACGMLILLIAGRAIPLVVQGQRAPIVSAMLAALAVLVLACLSTLLPARRAGLADPAELLRD